MCLLLRTNFTLPTQIERDILLLILSLPILNPLQRISKENQTTSYVL